MALSDSTNYTVTRADVVKRALRIIGAIGQGETPSTDAITEASQALNELVKEWNADGMHLWKIRNETFSLVSGTVFYYIGIGAATVLAYSTAIQQKAPLKILQAFIRTSAVPILDSPLIIYNRFDYQALNNKFASGLPNAMYYQPPGPGEGVPENIGILHLYPAADATTVASKTLIFTAMFPFDDFDGATNNADFPQFYYNALAWGLADQLSYEYGVPFAQQAMITKKAEVHLAKALGFDREEGSLFLQPEWTGERQ